MKAWLLPLALGGLIAGASAQDFADRLSAAQAEAEAAEKRAAKLRADAERAGSQAERLAARQQALAEEIAADEARLSEEVLQFLALRRRREAHDAALAEARKPISGLLAGLATMARQPPLLALADSRSVEEMIRVQALIDASLPAIAERAASVEQGARKSRQLEAEAQERLVAMSERREKRDAARARFAAQEAEVRRSARNLADAAFSADRRSLAVAENFAELGDTAHSRQRARANARALAQYEPAPRRPRDISAAREKLDGPADYRLPANADVRTGFGALQQGGIRSRGLTLATQRGARIVAPARGRILFAGPFRGYDGVVAIDHGDGWASLLTGIQTALEEDDVIGSGNSLGRALGPITVELWQNGTPRSPALIAGSSN